MSFLQRYLNGDIVRVVKAKQPTSVRYLIITVYWLYDYLLSSL